MEDGRETLEVDVFVMVVTRDQNRIETSPSIMEALSIVLTMGPRKRK